MRIRKRPPVVLETNPGDAIPHLSVNVPLEGADGDEFPSTCACCSRQRQLEYWELGRDLTQEDDEASIGFTGGRTIADDNQIAPTEDREQSLSAASENPGEVGRVQENEDTPKRNGVRRRNSSRGQILASEGDVKHPGNKPKESLLYSLYCVFSKLSGKAVLTAREALSRILEHRLPGLDEDTGLPSVQVAKVMRSNPYFVHLEGGKFFLCSAPSTDSKEETSAGDLLDTDISSRPASPRLRPKVAPLNGLSITECTKIDRKQPPSSIDGHRRKRARSSKGAPASDDSTSNKVELKSSASRKGAKTPKSAQKTLARNSKDEPEACEPICKRYDGRGWKCNEKALEGYSMCRHHHELIVNRLARLRNSGKIGSKKSSKRRKTSGKTVKSGSDFVADGDLAASGERNGSHWWKNVKARSLKSINK